MVKYKVINSFYDKELGKTHIPGDELDLAKERAELIIEHLKPFGIPFLEEVKKTRQKKEVKGDSEENG